MLDTLGRVWQSVLSLPPEELVEFAMAASVTGSSDDEEDDDCCVHCRRNDNAQAMLECDSCDAGWHMCIAAAATHHQRHALRSASPAHPWQIG